MKTSEKVSIKISSNYYNSFKDTNTEIEKPFKEFIDNSTQSYFDHKEELEKIPNYRLHIKIEVNKDSLVILDNAYGINKENFDRALRLGARSDKYSENSRSQYGVGLKYASMHLGDRVLIESTEYGSNDKFSAVLDSEELSKDIEYIDRYIETTAKNDHYTKITISKLRHEYTEETISKLVKKIGKMYSYDIRQNNVLITFNTVCATYEDPKLRIDSDTGSIYIEYFDDTVTFRGIDYPFNGWIGILEKANVSDAGFSLLQANRLIKSNYKPEKLFGKSNLYPSQRIVGDINLDTFPVVFNKQDFKWENGLEDEFINVLKQNRMVDYMIRTSSILRYKEEKQVDIKKISKASKKVQEKFVPLQKVVKTVLEKDKDELKEPMPAYLDSIDVQSSINVEYASENFVFDITFVTDDNENWMQLEKKKNSNHYAILLNKNFNFFNMISKEDDRIEVIQTMAITFALTEITSLKNGLKDSHKFTKSFSDIIRYLGKSK